MASRKILSLNNLLLCSKQWPHRTRRTRHFLLLTSTIHTRAVTASRLASSVKTKPKQSQSLSRSAERNIVVWPSENVGVTCVSKSQSGHFDRAPSSSNSCLRLRVRQLTRIPVISVSNCDRGLNTADPLGSHELTGGGVASPTAVFTESKLPGSFYTSTRLSLGRNRSRSAPDTNGSRRRLYSTVVLLPSGASCCGVGQKGVQTARTPARGNPRLSNMGQNSSRNSYSVTQGDGSQVPPSKDTSVDGTVVCSTQDLVDGQMKEVEVGDQKVLLVKENGQFYALGNKCTHYGAPLSKGSYCNGVVRCPWHGACFNVKTGDIEDFPGLDSVHTFQVWVQGTDVLVKANPASLSNFRRVKNMSKCVSSDAREVLIIGGGPASVVCAETLRQEGFTGKITLVTTETSLPYDRIKLSKTLSAKAEEIALRKEDFYRENDVNILLGIEVTQIDTAGKQVVLADGARLTYTSLVIATGGRPRKPDIPGNGLANVFTLRTVGDANAIAAKFKEKHVVVLGTSFIGLEVACSMVSNAASVSVVGTSAAPLLHVFGKEIGEWFQKLHESKGVKFYNSTSIAEFEGQDGVLSSVRLTDGTNLQADACVLGVGVVPATDFLKDSGLKLTDRGHVAVDKKMRTNLENVYAAGDITVFPLACSADESVNIQHWQMAHQHGRIAGLDIAGKGREINSVPYFWTVQFGKSIRYAGYHYGYDDLILHGNLEENKFVAFYTKSEKVMAAASLGWDPVVSQFAQLLAKGGSLSKQEARQDPSMLAGKLAAV